MRLLLVCHGLPPESVGGVEQHVDGLARALLKKGIDVHVYSKTGGDADQPQGMVVEDHSQPYPVHRVVYRYEDLQTLQDLYRVEALDRSFARFLSEQSFDLAHVHHLTGISVGALDQLRAAGIPSLLSLHDYWLICPRGQMWHREGSACERVEARRCADCLEPGFGSLLGGPEDLNEHYASTLTSLGLPARLIIPSARAMAPFLDLGLPSERFQVVENGVDAQALGGLNPPEPGAALRIGYLGSLIPSKGLHVLVQAFSQLAPGTASLHIHGNRVPYHGDLDYAERSLAGLGPEQGIFDHGPYETDDLPRILSELDLLVAPALWREAFGLTIREGLAAGRPALVSEIGGLADAVEEGVDGRLLEPGNVEQLGRALEQLCRDREVLGGLIAGAGRRRVRGFEEMAAELLESYGQVLAEGDPGQEKGR
jgi:glycosyltransferase involved in cell wall biosynthesis